MDFFYPDTTVLIQKAYSFETEPEPHCDQKDFTTNLRVADAQAAWP